MNPAYTYIDCPVEFSQASFSRGMNVALCRRRRCCYIIHVTEASVDCIIRNPSIGQSEIRAMHFAAS